MQGLNQENLSLQDPFLVCGRQFVQFMSEGDAIVCIDETPQVGSSGTLRDYIGRRPGLAGMTRSLLRPGILGLTGICFLQWS